VSLSSPTQTRELKRALAVQMFLNGYKHEIQGNGISSGFISKWTQMYELLGVAGLKLGYLGRSVISRRNSDRLSSLGSRPKLLEPRRTARVCATEYDVVFDSKQSYYSFLKKLGLAGKHRNVIPKKTQNWSKKRQEITDWLEAHRAQIVSGQLVVFFVDECHLLWGDLCGLG